MTTMRCGGRWTAWVDGCHHRGAALLITRRGFMASGAGFLLQAGAGVPSRLIVRSESPADFETPVPLLDRSWITPNELHFVRSHLRTPAVALATWRLTVDGQVERPLSLTLQDLARYRQVEQVVTLECSGNGRAFHDPPVPGIQWEKGAVGTARWSGVRLADVLRSAGVTSSGGHLIADGADTPVSEVPDFVRSIPLEKALHADTILATRMNGDPVPLNHGFPLRLIVPGWEGAASTKWLVHLQVSDREFDGFFMQTAYRIPTRFVAPGSAIGPADTVPYTELQVKSVFTSPLDEAPVRAGSRVELRGFAWAGEADIAQVDVSTDSGRTWSVATLGTDRAPYAWRRWVFPWTPDRSGSYLAMSRATDTRGRTQPTVAAWNPSGYLWNVIDKVRINVEI